MKSLTANMGQLDFSSAAIRSGLEKLPQEISDKIYAQVFTAKPGMRCPILRKSHPRYRDKYYWHAPEWFQLKDKSKRVRHDCKLLQVDHHSRELYARTFYGEHCWFVFEDLLADWEMLQNRHLPYRKFLEMLPLAHRAHLPKIVVALQKHGDSEMVHRARYSMIADGYAEANAANVFVHTFGEKPGELDDVLKEEGIVAYYPRTDSPEWDPNADEPGEWADEDMPESKVYVE